MSFQNLSMQIERVRWRATLAGCQVLVHQHLDGTLSLTHGPHCLGQHTAQGTPITSTNMRARRALKRSLGGKVIKPTFICPPPQGASESIVGGVHFIAYHVRPNTCGLKT